MTIAGATSPVTLAGTVAQGLAEFLGIATALQVAAPGARLVFCFGSGVLDMLRTTFALGSLESALMGAMATEVGHHLGVPTLNPGLSTDAKHAGVQAGYEKAMKAATVCGADPDIVSGWGLIDSHNTMSLPQSVIDNEMAAMLRRLHGPVEVSDGDAGRRRRRRGRARAAASSARRTPRSASAPASTTCRRVSNRLSYEKWVGGRRHRDTTCAERRGRAPAGRARGKEPYLDGDQIDELAAICGVDDEACAAPAASSGAALTLTKHPNGGLMTLRIGYIGLGALGRHLAGSLLRAGFPLTVYDVDASCSVDLGKAGATCAGSIAETARASDTIITCLPSPEAVASVVAEEGGVLEALAPGGTWIDMSTNDAHELQRLATLAAAKGIETLEAPVTGGVHRAAAGMITVLVGGKPEVFEKHRPAFDAMGGRVFYIGELGQASVIKVITNMLAFIHLVADGEALMLAKKGGIDLKLAWDVIKASSGNSFVHETEGQLILNGSYNINFTMDLARKDLFFAHQMGREFGVPLELGGLTEQIFARARAMYGGGAQSPMVVKMLEEAVGTDLRAPGFPAELEPE